MGELLSTFVPISDQDVEEILEEQNLSRRRFGEIAVEWGLCDGGHVWKAWARQKDRPPMRVDLDKLGIDAQATTDLPREMALRCSAIPIRAFENLVVIAMRDTESKPVLEEHFKSKRREVAIVLADAAQIETAIGSYYRA